MNAIRLSGVGKHYNLYASSVDRLREVITGRPRHRVVHALQPCDLTVQHGEVVGVVGDNGAGKSTLLKLVTGTLAPSSGTVNVDGRISALLELGAGFHPELSGRDNVYLSGTMAGLSRQEIDELYPGIVDFSGVADFIEQPVKTYSSGMFVRLAFSVATAVDPGILIIDEALSVGDGAFSRRSFDRIMAFRDLGKTILFCSHSLYQVDAICSRVIWLDRGSIRMDGEPKEVLAAYSSHLDKVSAGEEEPDSELPAGAIVKPAKEKLARVRAVGVSADGEEAHQVSVESGEGDLRVRIRFDSDPSRPAPVVAMCLVDGGNRRVTSMSTHEDDFAVERDADGGGEVTVTLSRLPLLRGDYRVDVFLLCEQGIHLYDAAKGVGSVSVTQRGRELGVVRVPHHWE